MEEEKSFVEKTPDSKLIKTEDFSPECDGQQKPSLKMQIAATVTCCFIQLSFGVALAFTGVTLPALTDPNSGDIFLTKFQASWFTSGITLGAMIGGLLSGFIMVWFGQRKCLILVLPIGIGSWLTMSVTTTYWQLLMARIVLGAVIGICTGCSSNFIPEIAHMSIRGRLMAITILSMQIGLLIMFIVGSSSLSWRNSAILAIIPMVIPFLGCFFLRDSPRWLASRERYGDAASSLQFYRGHHYNWQEELNEIQIQTKQLKSNKNRSINLFFKKFILKRIFLLTYLMISFHFTGSLVFLIYSVSVFQDANVPWSPYLCTITVGVVRVLGTGFYLLVVDKFGRKFLLVIPMIVCGICMAAFGTFFYLEAIWEDVTSISWLPLASMLIFSFFVSISNPVVMLVRSELLPTQIRAAATGFLNFIFFLAAFLSTFSYPYLIDLVGSYITFWIFASICFLSGIISLAFLPETQNKSLEQASGMKEMMNLTSSA